MACMGWTSAAVIHSPVSCHWGVRVGTRPTRAARSRYDCRVVVDPSFLTEACWRCMRLRSVLRLSQEETLAESTRDHATGSAPHAVGNLGNRFPRHEQHFQSRPQGFLFWR